MKRNLEGPDPELNTFRHSFARDCNCSGKRFATREHVLQQASRGGAVCAQCGIRSDLRKALEHFNSLGRPEALFGLDVFHFRKDIPASNSQQVIIVDPEVHLPYEAELVYAHYTPSCDSFDDAPWLLAPQSSHQPWHMHMRFYIPPGKARAVDILLAVKSKAGLPEPLEIALQAVDAFHRNRLNLAGLLLAAAVEAILRPVIEVFYQSRNVHMPQDLGFASLLERAQLLLVPQIGAQMIGYLRKLASKARNPSAHGRPTDLDESQVAMWMVDVAVLYEWSRVARPIVNATKGSASPPSTTDAVEKPS